MHQLLSAMMEPGPHVHIDRVPGYIPSFLLWGLLPYAILIGRRKEMPWDRFVVSAPGDDTGC